MRIFLLLVFLLVSLCARLDRYFCKSNDSFCLKYIFPKWPSNLCLPTHTPEPLEEILHQPFTYLAKGKQSFVFKSEDGKWVLKFPRLSRKSMRLSWKIHSPSSLVSSLEKMKDVYEELQEETRLVYAHLTPTKKLGTALFIDRFGHQHLLCLDELPFYIQGYGENFFSFYEKAEDPKPLIEKTIELFSRLYEKGFIDRDPILDKNFGVIHGIPFIVDIGQVEKCENLPPRQKYLMEMTQSLGGKLARESPELYLYYKSLL